MSRLRHVIHGVTTGYLLLAATAIYALGSVPIALHYLNGERFGLWALLGSVIGYLGMIDFGMSASIGRYLIDSKDDRKGVQYGSAVQTGWLVLIVQGILLMAVGAAGAGVFSDWMEIPSHLKSVFQAMVWMQSGVVAIGFGTKMFHCLLIAHHRMDLANWGGIVGLTTNFLTLWLFFSMGADVFSLIFAGFVGTLASSVFQFAACRDLALFPGKGRWGSLSRQVFREMFSYGRDVFLVVFGSQLIMASQAIIVTRTIGLEAAGIWSIATRTFTLVGQIVWRISQTSLSALSEMLSRGERDRLRDRYSSLASLAGSLSAYCAVTFALCNSAFISFWTAGKIAWPAQYDFLLGVWLIVLTWLNTNGNLVLATKNVGFMKYVYFVEGVVFVSAAILGIRMFGFPGMLISSIFCSVFFSGAYGAWRISGLLELSLWQIVLGRLKPAALVLITFLPFAALTFWATKNLDPRLKLLAGVGTSVFVGMPLFLRLGVPDSLKREVASRSPKRFGPLLERALGCAKAGT